MTDDLINTRESPGEFDALARLRPGEPYFPLVGRDRFAPPLIREWADRNRKKAIKEFGEGLITAKLYEREIRKSTQAEMIAESMVEYKNNWEGQRPNEGRIETYSGHELPEDIKRRDAVQRARSRAAAAVNNAVAEMAALAELLKGGEAGEADQANLLNNLVGELTQFSDEVAPRRIMDSPTPLLDAGNG